MEALHNSFDAHYRNPFGAATPGGAVTLCIDVWDEALSGAAVRLWQEELGEELVDMALVGPGAVFGSSRYQATVVPRETGVLWYSFQLEAANGAVWQYGAQEGRTGGPGAFCYGQPPSFQITVYQETRTKRPEWYENGLVYQIFPDRFARGEDWPDRAQRALKQTRKGPARALVQRWDTLPEYAKDEDGRVVQWDFWGGSLQGIREKLDYLEALGVTVLYLNPIFEAASNHRYDTGDYTKIDPLLGDNQEFRTLCEDAAAHGIAIILDGVFNHAGCDSRYFNKYGNYAEVGAYQSADSPYRGWFNVAEDGSYTGWWGVDDLPDYNEEDPTLRAFFCGEDGVVRQWLRAGARGWRLDVVDEIPDDFVRDIKAALLAESPDAVLIGEVWEDASNKQAYGLLRHYFQGEELDGTMNYPFRNVVLGFLAQGMPADEAAWQLNQLAQNYPPKALACALNLLGSHDRERLLTMLGGRQYPLDAATRKLAKKRLWQAAALQMTLPGVPCVYYGDEAGLEGMRDPANRGPFPWGAEDVDCRTMYRSAMALRRSLDVFAKGTFEPFAAGDSLLGYWRRHQPACESSCDVCVLVNRSATDWAPVQLETAYPCCIDLVSGFEPAIDASGRLELQVEPQTASVLCFYRPQGLQRPLQPGLGVIAHITSLPNVGGPATLGKPAQRFCAWAAEQGLRYWQMLPVNPTDSYGSPYAGLSAFAGNPNLVEWPADREAYLKELAKSSGYQEFCQSQAFWLDAYAAFTVLKEEHCGSAWQTWPAARRRYTPALLQDPVLAPRIERQRRIQYAFQVQWDELRAQAQAAGVQIIGDMPMYVSLDSADVWANPQQFALDEDGYPAEVAGVPPDDLGPEGQVWGNPTYNWKAMAADGYAWWLARLERSFALYDYVRIDHFLGFSSYYTVPVGKSAHDGMWRYGPGRKLFDAAMAHFGHTLPLIAENLGTITPAVRALVAECGFPGMDVVQFFDGDPRAEYRPAANAIAYTGTHDTHTLTGWCESEYSLNREDALHLSRELMRKVANSPADVAIFQLQDLLELGDEARMNVPATTDGNWSWQAETLPEHITVPLRAQKE
ncbi:MAG: 4-alpha-glucanotransferase [Coriobacteriia bacterium]|nr:4-alpha-glucanotransferase [Coriobacteriia bacterium]